MNNIANIIKKIKSAFLEKKEYDRYVYNYLLDQHLQKYQDYTIESFDEGFKNRFNNKKIDKKIIERIIISYNKAKADQKSAGQIFFENNEWTTIYQSHLKNIISSLLNNDVNSVGNSYENFWRDPCSTGLVGLPLDMKKHYFVSNIKNEDKMVALRDGFWRFNLWKALAGKNANSDSLLSPNVGNPYGFVFEGKFIRSGADYHSHYASQIIEIAKTCNKKIVLELGGGFGGMAYYFLKQQTRGVRYYNFDLPENLALSAYYLLSALPEKKYALYGEVDLEQESHSNYDAVLFPNFAIEALASNSASIAFNSYSLAEMSKETIEYYIKEITRIVSDYILHVNHTVNSLVVADDFGIENHGFARLYKAPALWNVGRNIHMDEYEYLFKKYV